MYCLVSVHVVAAVTARVGRLLDLVSGGAPWAWAGALFG